MVPDDDSIDEDDPETYVNTEEKKIELELERRLEKENPEAAKTTMAVDSKEFAEYFRKLHDDAKNNAKRSHICVQCWTLLSKAGLYKHRKSGHEVLDNFKIKSIEQIVGIASSQGRLTTANGKPFAKAEGEKDVVFKVLEAGDFLRDFKGAHFPPFDCGKGPGRRNYVDL